MVMRMHVFAQLVNSMYDRLEARVEGYLIPRFLQSLTSAEVSYTVVVTAFWAIETVYQESFALCLESGSKTPAELIETCHRWGNAGFGQYCQSIQGIADRCLEKAPSDEVKKAEEVFLRVLSYEINFWNMSSGDS